LVFAAAISVRQSFAVFGFWNKQKRFALLSNIVQPGFVFAANKSLKLAEKRARDTAARCKSFKSNNSVGARTRYVNLSAFRRRLAPVR
jgi:hypothetical protein